MPTDLGSRPVAAPREAHADLGLAQVDEEPALVELRREHAQLLVAGARGRVIERPRILAPDVEEPVLVHVVDDGLLR
jgi:hypothetical protein